MSTAGGGRPAVPAPRSAIPLDDGLFGLLALTLAWLIAMNLRMDALPASWFVLLATAAPMLAREARRASGPASQHRPASAGPIAWVAGFLLAALPFMVLHWQASGLWVWIFSWLVALPAFALRFLVEIRRNGPALSGGFPVLLGRTLRLGAAGRWRDLAAPARLWALKAIFIPLYAASLYFLLRAGLANPLDGPAAWLGLLVTFAYTIDLAFALSGYVFASNRLIPTVRSTQTLVFGWAVCLMCYAPVFVHWPAFREVVTSEVNWPGLIVADPLTIAGAAAMLALLAIYVSASVSFGLRFSNLTNRGLIAHGPYRLMKHPAYMAHIGNAWIITFVFVPAAGLDPGPTLMLVPIAFTVLYTARALTEERHMREDPAYVAYCGWIARHGIVGRARRGLRSLLFHCGAPVRQR